MKRHGTKQQAAKAKTHDFRERPTSLDGETEMACAGCGAPQGEHASDECPAVDLSEETPALKAPEAPAPTTTDTVRADAAELPPPAQPRLPLPTPPFDGALALERIFSRTRAVHAAKSMWDAAAAKAKDRKAEWEKLSTELDEMITKYDQEQQDAERAMAPRLVFAKDRPDTFAHVAGEPGERVQTCRRCGAVLVSALDAGGAAYVPGTEIGDNCEPAETTDAPEAGESLANA